MSAPNSSGRWSGSSGIFLYNARNAEALSFNSYQRSQNIASAYDMLTKRARALQLRFNLALFFVSLALVGLAVWFALRFADRQVEPLTELVAAARKVVRAISPCGSKDAPGPTRSACSTGPSTG